MIQQGKRALQGNVFPNKQIITPLAVVKTLSDLRDRRAAEVFKYPFAKDAAKKVLACGNIQIDLNKALSANSDAEIISLCLGTEKNFRVIAPYGTADFKHYNSLLENLMRACTAFLTEVCA